MKLETLWTNNQKKLNLKVRYKDWNYKLKYFQITGVDEKSKKLIGIDDLGEKVSYALDSDHWELYFEGLENNPKAV